MTTAMRVRKMSPAQEADAWRRFKSEGCREARARLIEHHVPLAVAVVRERFGRSRRADLEELTADAFCALIRAVDKFDPSLGVPFSAFAGRKIVWHAADRFQAAASAARAESAARGRPEERQTESDREVWEVAARWLSKKDWLVFKARFVLGGTVVDAGKAIGASGAAACQRIRDNIVPRLRKALAAWAPEGREAT